MKKFNLAAQLREMYVCAKKYEFPDGRAANIQRYPWIGQKISFLDCAKIPNSHRDSRNKTDRLACTYLNLNPQMCTCMFF